MANETIRSFADLLSNIEDNALLIQLDNDCKAGSAIDTYAADIRKLVLAITDKLRQTASLV